MNEIKKRTFTEKIKFIFQEMFPKMFKGKIKYITLLNIISGTFHPVMSVVVIKYILEMVNEQKDAENVILAISIYTLIFILCNIINRVMENKYYIEITNDRISFFSKTIMKITTMDHEFYENAEFMLKVEQSFNGIGSDNFGYQYVLLKLFDLLPNLFVALIFSFILFQKSILIVLVIITGLILNFIFSTKIADFINKNRDNVDVEMRKINSYKNVAKDFSYGKDIRVYKLKDSLIKNIYKFIDRYVYARNKEFKFKFKISFLENFTITITDLSSFLLLAYLAYEGKITIPDLVMSLSMIVLFTNTIHNIKSVASNIYVQTPYVMDTYDFYRSDLNFNKNGKTFNFYGKPVNIKFENVSYKYPGSENYVFENLSFEIEAEKRIAIVGVNGAGKTTIVKLLTGLAKPTSGNIFINGLNMKEFSDQTIFDLYSVVFQETAPLALTVAENISCLENDIDFKKVEKVLKKVGLWDKISSLKDSYNSNLLKVLYDDGTILSGGENQKLMIARALYKENTSVMIMDEPTSALDAFAEEKIYQEFDSYMGNKTALFISHRLASTKFCDEIMFLDGGKIIAKGTHDDLMKNCDDYKQMFETQGKYYKETENEKI